MMIRLALADDEMLFREGLKILIESFDGMEFQLEASNGQELLDGLAAASSLPDVLLLDLNMPGMNGVETTKRLQVAYPQLKIIILSSHFTKAFIINMIELGADSYLPKNSQPDDLEDAIRKVYKHGFHYSTEVMIIIRDNMVKKVKPKATFTPELTRRELEVLQLICEQYSSSEIGEKLFISPRTVDGHRNNLLEKLGVRNTAGLVVYAVMNSLVSISPDHFWNNQS